MPISCIDNPSFSITLVGGANSANNLNIVPQPASCSDWAALPNPPFTGDCSALIQSFDPFRLVTPEEEDEIRENCPLSCDERCAGVTTQQTASPTVNPPPRQLSPRALTEGCVDNPSFFSVEMEVIGSQGCPWFVSPALKDGDLLFPLNLDCLELTSRSGEIGESIRDSKNKTYDFVVKS